jgi:cytochrome c biogenesis protein CcmG/thiol:disulfide interchange protein DsbE
LLDQQSPQFALPSLQDPSAIVGSADYAGEITLVNVWATWCGGCRDEHGYLMELAARGTVPIFGLNWRDKRTPALSWLQQLGNPYVTSAYDEDGRVGIDWGVYGAPETFLIAADGTVLYKHISPMNEQVWAEEFLPRIQAARGGAQ